MEQEIKEKLLAYAGLVDRMRDTQKKYFAAPRDTMLKSRYLHESKALETEVDALTSRILRPRPKTGDLYGMD